MEQDDKKMEPAQTPAADAEGSQPQQPKGYEAYLSLYDLVRLLAVITLVFVFFFRLVGVSGSSMYPTLHDKDIMLAYRLGYTPAQGDVVVIRKESFMEEAIVKRVIATEGQEVEINYDTNTVYVDGVAMDEPYINQEDADVMEEKQGMVYKEFTVPEGCIFVMGDNRNGSTDSRFGSLGMVDTDYVLGRAVCVVFPFSDFKSLL